MPAPPISILAIFVALCSFQLSAADAEAQAPSGRRIVGGWKPIKDLADPTVVRIAKFAVTTYSQRVNDFEPKFKLIRVLKGDIQAVAGRNYRLLIEIRNANPSLPAWQGNLKAVVHVNPGGKLLKIVSLHHSEYKD